MRWLGGGGARLKVSRSAYYLPILPPPPPPAPPAQHPPASLSRVAHFPQEPGPHPPLPRENLLPFSTRPKVHLLKKKGAKEVHFCQEEDEEKFGSLVQPREAAEIRCISMERDDGRCGKSQFNLMQCSALAKIGAMCDTVTVGNLNSISCNGLHPAKNGCTI